MTVTTNPNPRRWLAILPALLVLFAVLTAPPAVGQTAADVVGDWVSEDGAVRLELRANESFRLIPPPMHPDLDRMTGNYRLRVEQGFMLVRAVEVSGGFRVDLVSLEEDRLTLSSDDLLGGTLTFTVPYQLKDFLEAPVGVFIVMTLIMFGGAAVLTGQAMGNGWQPAWKAAAYAVLLGVADRFMVAWLFQGDLLSIWGFVFHSGIFIAIALIAHRYTVARKMCGQYPWLYERAGPFRYRERAAS